ncbi:MAG: HD domain-containing protein, partial [Candidatus Hydrogenedentes bacterium]|nr:HD domain-containing protein [Candidatus Hydrogenedentota bacterium]
EIPEETPEPPPAAVRQDAPEKTPVKRIEPSPEPSPSIDIDQDTHGKTPIKAPTANAGEQMKSHAPEELVKTFFGTPPVTCTSTELKDIQKRLAAVYAANQTIASEQSLTKVFENIMSEVFSLVKAHNGLIMLKQEDVKELAVEYARPSKDGNEIHVSSTIINRVFDQGEAIITNNASQDARFNGGMSIIKAEISSAMCVPLTHQGEKLGVIYVDNRGTTNAFEDSDLEMLVAVAAPAATAIKNARYLGMIEDAYDDTLKALANAIELRDHYTVGHTLRVTNFAVKMARELKWDEEKISEVKRGGVLHDIGKIAVDNAILGKPGKLTEEEFAQMQVHPDRGADLLREVKFLHPLISYCLCHHEKWDGSGYPCGLKGEDIPIEGRIIAVADAFDAMTSTRPYRKGMAPDIAIERLKEGKEKQFDATMVDALEKCFESGKIDRILQDYYKNEARSIACPFCSTFIRLDDNTDNSSEIECSVCHKNVRVIKKEETYFGVLATKR